MENKVIINNCNVANCKYYVENNGVEYQGLHQYTDMCYKEPYDFCEAKPLCFHKIITRIRNIINKIKV